MIGNIILASILLLVSYFIRAYEGLSIKTFSYNTPPIFRSSVIQFIVMLLWTGLLIYASYLLYQVGIIYFVIGLIFYFFIFNFFFLKKLIKSFGGDGMFPENMKRYKQVVDVMIHSYNILKNNKMKDSPEKRILYKILKMRYPFMKKAKKEKINQECFDINDLTYKVMEMEFIDLHIKKGHPLKGEIDRLIKEKMEELRGLNETQN